MFLANFHSKFIIHIQSDTKTHHELFETCIRVLGVWNRKNAWMSRLTAQCLICYSTDEGIRSIE